MSRADEQGSSSFEIHRLKGRLLVRDGSVKMVQGVREIFEIIDVEEDRPTVERKNHETAKSPIGGSSGKLVLIGRGIAELKWSDSLYAWLERRHDAT